MIGDVTASIAAFGLVTPNRLDVMNWVVDINGDGIVSLPDLTLVLGNFGRSNPHPWP